jgi:hypothetical protein
MDPLVSSTSTLLGDDGGGEPGLRDLAADGAPAVAADRQGRLLHHHPQRPAPSLRRHGPQLLAAQLPEHRRRVHEHHHVADPAGDVPAAPRERAARDGLPRCTVARNAGGRGCGGCPGEEEDGEQRGGREEEEAGGGRHAWLLSCRVSWRSSIYG